MKLDLFNRANSINFRSETRLFIDELSKHFEEDKINLKSSMKLADKRDQIVSKYAQDTGELCYILYKNNNEKSYLALSCDKMGRQTKTTILESELPKNIEVNMVIREENGKYKVDKEATEFISRELLKNSYEILKEQDSFLNSMRKEGSLYYVVEGKPNRVFLSEFGSEKVFEEVNISKELKNTVSSGFILRYENREYHIEEELTDKSFRGLLEEV